VYKQVIVAYVRLCKLLLQNIVDGIY